MNGAVAGLNQVAGVSHRFISEVSAEAGALPGCVVVAVVVVAVVGAGSCTGVCACAAAAEESGFGHDGDASRQATTAQISFDASAPGREYLVARIRAQGMFKTFSLATSSRAYGTQRPPGNVYT
jgi:hypothetical protein